LAVRAAHVYIGGVDGAAARRPFASYLLDFSIRTRLMFFLLLVIKICHRNCVNGLDFCPYSSNIRINTRSTRTSADDAG
jgi:hypothetical protein